MARRFPLLFLITAFLMVFPVIASASNGSSILKGIKFRLPDLFSSSDVSTSHHADREEAFNRAAHDDCWTKNTWKETRYGRRVIKREQECRR